MRTHTWSRARRQSGFIISVELLLIFSILVIGSLVGVIAVRNALLRYFETRQAAQVWIKDSSTPDPLIIGRPVSYDLCEAPQIYCPDAGFSPGMLGTPGDSAGLRALVGVRPDRFVTRNQIYFTGDGCTGEAYIAPPPVPGSPNFPPSLPVGYFNCGIQVDAAGDPVCYGAGPPSDWPCSLGTTCADGGRLYRSDGTTTATPDILSRWVSLNPDCALDPGSSGELVVNGGFEDPAFLNNGDFFPNRNNIGPLVGWQRAPGIFAGWEDPCVAGEAAPCTNGSPSYTVPLPEGKQIGFALGFPAGPDLTQTVDLTPGDLCTFVVWIGCHSDSNCAGAPAPITFNTEIVDSVGALQFPAITGAIGGGVPTPEWQMFTATFLVNGTTPHEIRLDSSRRETNFDAVSLVCQAAALSTDICDDSFETSVTELLPAIEVTDMAGVNVLAPYMPLFNVMPPVAPTFIFTPPEPEATPMVPPPSPLTPPEPEDG